jgi:hypothetical protein
LGDLGVGLREKNKMKGGIRGGFRVSNLGWDFGMLQATPTLAMWSTEEIKKANLGLLDACKTTINNSSLTNK